MVKYKHKKTGKEYELVSDRLLFKDSKTELCSINDEISEREKYYWRKELVLYRALYECPDGPFFVRTREDFFNSFEKCHNEE